MSAHEGDLGKAEVEFLRGVKDEKPNGLDGILPCVIRQPK